MHDWAPPAAIASALGFLAAGWVVYDQICRRFGHRKDGSIGNDGLVLGLVAVFVVIATWAACQLFAGRAAFLIVGAMIATMMSANVLFWIIPGQKQVIADMRAGRPVDPVHGQRGKQRSVHNTFFGLPVLIAMLSNHYGMLYSHAQNWVVLSVLMAAGVLIRTFFVKRHKGLNRLGPGRWCPGFAGRLDRLDGTCQAGCSTGTDAGGGEGGDRLALHCLPYRHRRTEGPAAGQRRGGSRRMPQRSTSRRLLQKTMPAE